MAVINHHHYIRLKLREAEHRYFLYLIFSGQKFATQYKDESKVAEGLHVVVGTYTSSIRLISYR